MLFRFMQKLRSRVEIVNKDNEKEVKILSSTPGRILISEILPKNRNITFSMINKVLSKKELAGLIDVVYRFCGQKETVIFADRLMELGF